MTSAIVSLPILPVSRPLRLTPTDVSMFVRLEQCERFLRFRLAERAGQQFMEDYDVTPQRITPLLSRSGHQFEEGTEKALGNHFRTVHYAARAPTAPNRPENKKEVVNEARKLKPGKAVLFFQPRLNVEWAGWQLRGALDLVRLERQADGTLLVLIGDMKSTVEVKVEHRLQVAFYRLMLERLFKAEGVAHQPVQMGILFWPPADPPPEDPLGLPPPH